MSSNKEFNFSEVIPLKTYSEGVTAYSEKTDIAKREIAVVAALHLINTSLSSGALTVMKARSELPKMVKTILAALEGDEGDEQEEGSSLQRPNISGHSV